jgi:Tfp pilus assembly protein PilX
MIADQTGATLIIVVLVLLAVTALGLTAITISTNDLNMAGNDKWQRTGFYNADSGLHGTPLVIAPVFDNNPLVPEGDPGNPANTACLQYLDSSNGTKFETFSKKMLNIVGAGGCDQNLKTTKDIAFRACGIQADMDICPLGARESSGSGVRFGASTEGLGSGAGGKGMYFRITATGDGSSVNSTYNVFGVYRWVEESGGLK